MWSYLPGVASAGAGALWRVSSNVSANGQRTDILDVQATCQDCIQLARWNEKVATLGTLMSRPGWVPVYLQD